MRFYMFEDIKTTFEKKMLRPYFSRGDHDSNIASGDLNIYKIERAKELKKNRDVAPKYTFKV